MEVKGEKLEIGYDGRIVVREMDITVKKGEITTIIGPNGSGKSTLLKALTRLLRCSMGCVYLNQEDLYDIDSKKLAKCIGVLPQRHCAPPDFKVRDLVGYGRVPYQKWYEQNTEDDEKIIGITPAVLTFSGKQQVPGLCVINLFRNVRAVNRSGYG